MAGHGAGGSFSTSTLTVGTHTVTAAVTDSGNLSGSATITITVTGQTTEPPAGITLDAIGYKVKGTQHADLVWSGATSTSIDIFRNGVKIATVSNSGSHTDLIGGKGGGSYTYKVCEAGTSTCSPDKVVVF